MSNPAFTIFIFLQEGASAIVKRAESNGGRADDYQFCFLAQISDWNDGRDYYLYRRGAGFCWIRQGFNVRQVERL